MLFGLTSFALLLLQGVDIAVAAARAAYAAAGAPEKLRLFVEPGVGHDCTPAALAEVAAWMDAHLKPQAAAVEVAAAGR
jgi:hypothetical protein